MKATRLSETSVFSNLRFGRLQTLLNFLYIAQLCQHNTLLLCHCSKLNFIRRIARTLLLLIFAGLNFRYYRKIAKLRSRVKRLSRKLTTRNLTSHYKTLPESQLLLQSMPIISKIENYGADSQPTCLFCVPAFRKFSRNLVPFDVFFDQVAKFKSREMCFSQFCEIK